jgi:hypothetical protein
MDIGNLGIALVLEDDGAVESRMTLARLAAELDTAFLAIIVYVADPERALRLALEAYCQLHPETYRDVPLERRESGTSARAACWRTASTPLSRASGSPQTAWSIVSFRPERRVALYLHGTDSRVDVRNNESMRNIPAVDGTASGVASTC